jgi:hypothetical protein
MQKTPMQFNSSLIKSASLTIKQMQGRWTCFVLPKWPSI